MLHHSCQRNSILFCFGLSFVILLNSVVFVSQVNASICKSNQKAKHLFKVKDKIYVSSGSSDLNAYNVANHKHYQESVDDLTNNEGHFKDVRLAIYFDPINSCESEISTLEFCEHSRVWDGMLAVVGTSTRNNGLFKFYKINSNSKKLVDYNHPFDSMKSSPVLPDVNSRLYASMYVLFKQMSSEQSNKLLKFTGVTYNNFDDVMYMTVTIMNDSIANSPQWGLGKHIMFRANFTPIGVIQDAIYVTKFDQEFAGLIDYNGLLYGLTTGGKILEMNTDGRVSRTFSVEEFFNCNGNGNSPISKAENIPKIDRKHNQDSLPKLQGMIFPFYPREIKVVESSLLSGGTFIAIVTVLTLLLILIVAVDGFIIYSMSKADDVNDLNKKSPIGSMTRSSPQKSFRSQGSQSRSHRSRSSRKSNKSIQ